MSPQMQWKVHTHQLLKEVLTNNSMAILQKPLNIFQSLLAAVGERAAELNDPELNALMCRLTIYDIADPQSKDYNPIRVDGILNFAERCKAGKPKK